MSDNEKAAVDSGSSLQAGAEQTMARLLIRNLPPDIDKAYLEMFFENRRKFGDVEVVDVEINENMSRALVKFKTQSDVKAVLSREPITMKRRTIQLVEVKTQPMDIVVVKGHVDIVNKDNTELLEMYFESQKRSSGGEVTDVSYDCRQNACFVKFKDEKVAKRVVEQEKHTLQGHSLSVCLYDKLTAVLDGYESDDTTLSNQRRTVKVTGVRQLMTQSHDILHLYFESRKSSGGDLHEIKTDEHDDDVIYVEFKHGKDARSVAEKQDHTLRNVNLHTELHHPPQKLMLHGNRLFIQGLSTRTTRTALELFLEAKCTIIPETITYHTEKQDCVLVSSKSKIDFENMKDVIDKFRLDGHRLEVASVNKSCSILVGNIPRGLSADTMQQYFENKRRSSGGSVKSIAFAEDSDLCLVTFSDTEAVERVLNTDHVIEDQQIHLAEFFECVQSSERNLIEKAAVFRQVFVKVDESKLKFIKQSKKIQAELQVTMKQRMCDVDLSQLTKPNQAILSFKNHDAVPLSFNFIENWSEMTVLSFDQILGKISSAKLPLKTDATKHVIRELQDDLIANNEDVSVSPRNGYLEIVGNEEAIKASVKWFDRAMKLNGDENKLVETLAFREVAKIKLSETTKLHLVNATIRGMLVDMVVCPVSADNDVQIDERDEVIRSAGNTIEKECQRQTEDNKTFVTMSGHLPCRHIIHTFGFHGKENVENLNESLTTVLCTSLAKAKELKASSVAVPFTDWGLTRMTSDEVTRETIRSFKMFVADNEDLPIKDVYLCSGIKAHISLLLEELFVQFHEHEVDILDKGFVTEKDRQRQELEQSGNDELVDENELVLHNLPDAVNETVLLVYFEDFRVFGDTKVSNIKMSVDNASASVFFQDKKSLQRVLSKQPLKILGQTVDVTGADTNTTIKVQGPSDMTIFTNDHSALIRTYFEHPRSSGGPVLEVMFDNSSNEYMLTFVNSKDAKNAIAREHVIGKHTLSVSKCKKDETKVRTNSGKSGAKLGPQWSTDLVKADRKRTPPTYVAKPNTDLTAVDSTIPYASKSRPMGIDFATMPMERAKREQLNEKGTFININEGNTILGPQIKVKAQAVDFDARNVQRYEIGGFKVHVYEASLVKLPVDCIVNAANDRLSHGGGIAYAISKAAGPSLTDEGDRYIRQRGKIPVGEVRTTTAGNLPYRCVIHAVGPAWWDYKKTVHGINDCCKHLYNAIYNSLMEAERLGMASIALPAISSAIFGVPMEICAVQYAQATLDFCQRSGTTLKEVHFIDIKPDVVNNIQLMFDRMIKRKEPVALDIDTFIKMGGYGTVPCKSSLAESVFGETIPTGYAAVYSNLSKPSLSPTKYGAKFGVGPTKRDQIYLCVQDFLTVKADAVTVVIDQSGNGGRLYGQLVKKIPNKMVSTFEREVQNYLQTNNNVGNVFVVGGCVTEYKLIMPIVLPYNVRYEAEAVRKGHLKASYETVFDKGRDVDSLVISLIGIGIRTEQMRGQGYDGASNMSGIHRGVQARIRALVPEAIYTHCKAHCLNLAVIHACKEVYVRNLMTTVQQVAFAFNYSAKRLLQFQETLAADDVSREAMQERTRLRSLCETRWSARADALHTFLAAYRTVVTSLDTLAAGGDTKAAVYKLSVLSFEFVISLVATEHLLSALVPLSNMLQAKDCDLLHAANDARVVMVLLQAERNDDDVWDSLFQKATGIAADVDVVPTAPRQRGRQQNRPNAPGDVSQFWKRNMYLPFVDHLLAEIDTRLMQGHGRFCAQKLIPLKVQNDGLTREVIGEVFDAFRACLDVDVATFVRECERWNTLWTNLALAPDRPPAPSSLAESIAHASNALYPSIRQCLIILMVMPVSTATAERSFSVMRRVKTYLRSTMGTERMSGLGLMNVYREKEISAEHVVDVFANKQNRRLAFIFKV